MRGGICERYLEQRNIGQACQAALRGTPPRGTSLRYLSHSGIWERYLEQRNIGQARQAALIQLNDQRLPGVSAGIVGGVVKEVNLL